MKHIEHAVLLIGSAKREGESTSAALGSYLSARLQAQGVAITTLTVHRALRTPERTVAMLDAINACDLLILAFPLYVDTLPALMTQALERIAEHRRVATYVHTPWLLAIANCGFPEAAHNDVALEICRNFATATGMRWAGGLALGAGGAVNGQPVSERGMTHNVARALDLTADALLTGQPAPPAALALTRTPLMPNRFYTLMGNLGWRQMAFSNGVWRQLHAQPLAVHDR